MPSLDRFPTIPRPFRTPRIIAPVLLAAVTGGLWWFANARLQQADTTRAAAERALRKTRLEQARLAADTERVRWSVQRIGELLARGRFDAIGQQSLTARLGDFGRHYRLPPPHIEFSPATAISAGPYRLHQGTMRLRADLLHSGDLLALLHTLSETAGPKPVPKRCRIERIQYATQATAGFDTGPLPLLRTDCTLNWFSISESDDAR